MGRRDANELKSPEGGKEKEGEEGEHQDCSEIDAGFGAGKIPDTGGTSTLPKSSLAIKEELMQKRGLPLKKAIHPTVPRKKVQLIMPNPQ